MNHNLCQLCSVSGMGAQVTPGERLRQRMNRLKRFIMRRVRYLDNVLFRRLKLGVKSSGDSAREPVRAGLKPGDKVRVRSRKEISLLLNEWNQFKRCAFMEEMWPYCGTTQTVFKKVSKFLDERDYLVKKCSGTVILSGVMCEGTRDFGPCDRSCYFFWREEWLERVDDPPGDGIRGGQHENGMD